MVATVKVASHREGEGKGGGEAEKERLTWVLRGRDRPVRQMHTIVVANADHLRGADLNGKDVGAVGSSTKDRP